MELIIVSEKPATDWSSDMKKNISCNLRAGREFRDKKCWARTRLYGRGGRQSPKISDRARAGSQNF